MTGGSMGLVSILETTSVKTKKKPCSEVFATSSCRLGFWVFLRFTFVNLRFKLESKVSSVHLCI